MWEWCKIKTYKVYYHKVPKNISGYNHDKYYIGITCKKHISDRWGKNGKGYKTQVFYRAIEKYGWDNIEHKVLFDGVYENEAKEIEKSLISILKTNQREFGYNFTIGGDGVVSEKNVYHPVYCKELNILFKTVNVAGEYTGDNPKTIRSMCRTNGNSRTLQYTYCFIEDMYKYYGVEKMRANSIPIVEINTGKLYGNLAIASRIFNKEFNYKNVLNYDDYYRKKNKNKLRTNNCFMLADDYVRIFDKTAWFLFILYIFCVPPIFYNM